MATAMSRRAPHDPHGVRGCVLSASNLVSLVECQTEYAARNARVVVSICSKPAALLASRFCSGPYLA